MAISDYFLLACGLASLATLATSESPATSTSGVRKADQSKLVSSMNNFTFDLYKKISESNVGENVVLSPASIAVALAMLYAGAGGKTKFQIGTAMHLSDYSSDDDAINEGFKSLFEALNRANNNYTLQMANRLYVQSGEKFKDEYLKVTKEYYRASLQPVNFTGDPSGSREIINSWVAQMTSNNIKELFPEDSMITTDTVLALVNAIYLKAFWLYEFDKTATKPQMFHLSKNQTINIPTMKLQGPHRLGYTNSSELGCQVLELPYRGNQISMFVFLPHEIEGLSTLESHLGAKSLGEVFRAVNVKNHIQVYLPKFVLKHTLDLAETLARVGVKDLFVLGKADLSGIASAQLVVSKAMHKAFITAKEEGTEAAAATGFGVSVRSIIARNAIDFTVDRPFLFLLVEKTTGSILFVGRVTKPPGGN